ncbi:hypothetical protein [Flavobacterium terrigena]|uniref:Uncharacterized protein n=1 Tax=Flavobacterium terrigena TaxID=402734 RepID=A0A1H6SHV5_9FLAO|nr:hypothetical protein [Flavobacterium terrigena]SEI63600.1 hypothetical protein SAMN05660918_1230 [Flavobacterium terrigena]
MEKIKIHDLVKFRRKNSAVRKKNYALNLKTRKPKESKEKKGKGGGDYWSISTKCINKVFKLENNELLDLKINEFQEKLKNKDLKSNTIGMYKKNIDIMSNFKEFDFKDIRPEKIKNFESITKEDKILKIDNFPLYITPTTIFTFKRKDKIEIGAVWLVAQIDGFEKSELGLFCEILYRFLIKNYADEYQIAPEYCIAIDTFNAQKLSYNELLKGEIPFLIDLTLKEIKEL